MENEIKSIEIKVRWNRYNSILLTNRIYKIVEKNHIKARIDVNASELEVAILVLTAIGSLYPVAKDIHEWLEKRRKKKNLPEYFMKIDGKDYNSNLDRTRFY